VEPLGNHGLWLAMLLFMAACGPWLGLVYLDIERGGIRCCPELSSPAPVGLGL
jgi:hypothetical protein